MGSMKQFPQKLRQFIDDVPWTFAKTMPEWPHEYIVRKYVSDGGNLVTPYQFFYDKRSRK